MTCIPDPSNCDSTVTGKSDFSLKRSADSLPTREQLLKELNPDEPMNEKQSTTEEQLLKELTTVVDDELSTAVDDQLSTAVNDQLSTVVDGQLSSAVYDELSTTASQQLSTAQQLTSSEQQTTVQQQTTFQQLTTSSADPITVIPLKRDKRRVEEAVISRNQVDVQSDAAVKDDPAATAAVEPKLPLRCRAMNNSCPAGAVIFKSHGPLTGYCVRSDRSVSNLTLSSKPSQRNKHSDCHKTIKFY